MPRYVVLTHDDPFLHWDLMLQSGERLRTWRLLEMPAPERRIRAEALPDHRLLYLDYEGPVSGGRGEVRRWDSGAYTVKNESGDSLDLELDGEVLRGAAELRRRGGDWTFYFRTR